MKGNVDALGFLNSISGHGTFSVILFVLIGTVVTVLVQSSSAAMAITILLCERGIIPFEMAAGMVLGENIGTTITAESCSDCRKCSCETSGTCTLYL